MSLLDYYKIPVQNKKVAVIGRSKLAGGPIAQALEKRGALISVCHKGTENIEKVCRKADILISATGQIGLVNKKFVHKNQVVVDVGINKITFGPKEITPPTPLTLRGEPNGKIIQDVSAKPKFVGDVNFTEVEPIVKAITPVPGGVGPLTVACLFQNLLDLVSIK
jgi:methylenetetrahydrofolate dehydrogenase (NADP+)/methenyltetrahydrofolate cyclohydrolase